MLDAGTKCGFKYKGEQKETYGCPEKRKTKSDKSNKLGLYHWDQKKTEPGNTHGRHQRRQR